MPARVLPRILLMLGLLNAPLLMEALRAEDALTQELFVNGTAEEEEDEEKLHVPAKTNSLGGTEIVESASSDEQQQRKRNRKQKRASNLIEILSNSTKRTREPCDEDSYCKCGPEDLDWVWKSAANKCECVKENSFWCDCEADEDEDCRNTHEDHYEGDKYGQECTYTSAGEEECVGRGEITELQEVNNDLGSHESPNRNPDDGSFAWKKQVSAGNVAVVSQNQLPSAGDHACWAVARATANAFTGQITNTHASVANKAEWYYQKAGQRTGWFLPTRPIPYGQSWTMGKKHAKTFYGTKSGSDKGSIAKALHKVFNKGHIIIAAMHGGSPDCDKTFHYATMFGVAIRNECAQADFPATAWSNDFVDTCLDFLFIDQWCPDGTGGFMTVANKDTGFKKGKNCVKSTRMVGVYPVAGYGKPIFGNHMNYASEPRCMYKSWEVKPTEGTSWQVGSTGAW